MAHPPDAPLLEPPIPNGFWPDLISGAIPFPHTALFGSHDNPKFKLQNYGLQFLDILSLSNMVVSSIEGGALVLPDKGSIFFPGCGTGLDMFYFPFFFQKYTHLEGRTLVGIDFNSENLKRAKRNLTVHAAQQYPRIHGNIDYRFIEANLGDPNLVALLEEQLFSQGVLRPDIHFTASALHWLERGAIRSFLSSMHVVSEEDAVMCYSVASPPSSQLYIDAYNIMMEILRPKTLSYPHGFEPELRRGYDPDNNVLGDPLGRLESAILKDVMIGANWPIVVSKEEDTAVVYPDGPDQYVDAVEFYGRPFYSLPLSHLDPREINTFFRKVRAYFKNAVRTRGKIDEKELPDGRIAYRYVQTSTHGIAIREPSHRDFEVTIPRSYFTPDYITRWTADRHHGISRPASLERMIDVPDAGPLPQPLDRELQVSPLEMRLVSKTPPLDSIQVPKVLERIHTMMLRYMAENCIQDGDVPGAYLVVNLIGNPRWKGHLKLIYELRTSAPVDIHGLLSAEELAADAEYSGIKMSNRIIRRGPGWSVPYQGVTLLIPFTTSKEPIPER